MKKITLIVNGVRREVMAGPDKVLIDFLREDLHLTGTKQSCDREGYCGACTVVVNGKAVRSCITKLVNLEGADVISVEGLGTPENPHLIQEAFVLTGAIQCGFCTPGFIMATKGLLDQNPDPSVEEIKFALANVLCRCTGYKKIVDAVQLASRFMRGEISPKDVRSKIGKKMLGTSHPRPTAMLKACGLAQFSADIPLPPDALELAILHSTQNHAVIKSIDTSKAAKMPGVVGIITADDIKGTNIIRAMIPDQPVLCAGKVRVLGDPIAVVAASTRDQARAAVDAIEVEYDPLPALMTVKEALEPGAYQIHKHAANNIFASQPLIKGDAEKAIMDSTAIVEGEFSTSTTHMAPLEPEASAAYFEGQGENQQLVVCGRSIQIHDHLAQLKEALGYSNMRYREPHSGGQFGIKAAIITEALTAAAAIHFKRAARCVPSLEESILMCPKKTAYDMKVKLGADAKGKLNAYFHDFVSDKGAYTGMGITTFGRSLCSMQGCYYIPNIKGSGLSVYTNNVAGGPARGNGCPEVGFALESLMDILAEKLGVDALEFRRMNSLLPGQTKATGMPVIQWPFKELCDAVKPAYEKAKLAVAAFNAKGGKLKRGVGIACCAYPIGSAGEKAELSVDLDSDNGVTVYAACADPGEGNDAMIVQIVSHQLGLPLDKIRLYTRDTDKTVGMGPSAGSRMTLMTGRAIINAIENMQNTMKESGCRTYAELKRAGKPTHFVGTTTLDGKGGLDKKTGQGNCQTTECQNIQIAEVEVDTTTGDVRVVKIISAVDAGTIINPQVFEGQVEGGMDQGVGFALREEYINGKTRDYNTSFKFPTIRDMVDSEIITRETFRVNGTLGATGIGEMTLCVVAPAVTNAIYNACGARIYSLPATPDKVRAALAKRKKG